MPGPRILFIASSQSAFPGGPLSEDAFEVIGPHPVAEALGRVREEEPDALLLDVDVDVAAYDVLLQLHEAARPCRAVVIGTELSPEVVREAFFVGVYACFTKPLSGAAVRGALHHAVEGTSIMRSCIEAADDEGPSRPSGRVDVSALTPRERQILELLLEGRTTPAMARTLEVSPRTVKFHVANLLRKLGYGSRLALLAKLRRDDVRAALR